MSIRVFGFQDTDFHRVRDAIADIIGLQATPGETADWGEYFWYEAPHGHHHLVENVPSSLAGSIRDAPEPEFIGYHCIFYAGEGQGASRLTSALLAIGGRLLMPMQDRFYHWHPSAGEAELDWHVASLLDIARPLGKLH